MSDRLDKVKELTKKKILAIIPSNLELYGELYMVKLYSCDREGKNWLFSDVEGFCCLLINDTSKLIYLCIFDPFTYEKLFQYELYNNFQKYLEILAPDFLSFEIDSGFMGIRFETEEETEAFESVIRRLSGFKDDLFGKKTNRDYNNKLNNEKLNAYYKILKNNFMNENNNKYDELYSEDGTTILKHNNLKNLLNVSCNIETKQFTFGQISEELKDIFISLGIKKKDLESDSELAYTIVKKVLICLGAKTELQNSVVEQIEHNFPPPEEREKLRKQEEEAEAKMYSGKLKRKQTKRKGASKQNQKNKSKPVQTKPVQTKPVQTKPVQNTSKPVSKPQTEKPKPKTEASKPVPKPQPEKPKTKSQPISKQSPSQSSKSQTSEKPNISSIPPPPPPPPPPAPVNLTQNETKPPVSSIPPPPTPPPIPTAPPIPPTQSQTQSEKKTKSNPIVSNNKNEQPEENKIDSGEMSMEQQLANVKLKKVEKRKEPKTEINPRMQENDKNFLQNALSNAIKIRRKNLHLHDDDSDSEENDW